MKSPNTEPGLLGNVFTAILACVLSNSPNISKDHPWWLLFSPPCLCLTWVISVLYHRSCSIGLVQGMFYRKLPFTWKTIVSFLDFSLQGSDGWFSHWSLLVKLLWTMVAPWCGAWHRERGSMCRICLEDADPGVFDLRRCRLACGEVFVKGWYKGFLNALICVLDVSV